MNKSGVNLHIYIFVKIEAKNKKEVKDQTLREQLRQNKAFSPCLRC